MATLKTTIVDDVNKLEGWEWGSIPEYKGKPYFPILCGFCAQVKNKEGKIGYCSTVYTGDYDEMVIPTMHSLHWNDLGISAELASYNGYEPTGVIVFRGYALENYDFEERESFVEDVTLEEIENEWGGFTN